MAGTGLAGSVHPVKIKSSYQESLVSAVTPNLAVTIRFLSAIIVLNDDDEGRGQHLQQRQSLSHQRWLA